MTVTHPTVKVPGQQVHAVADWNADHLIQDVLPNADNLYALGSALRYWRDLYIKRDIWMDADAKILFTAARGFRFMNAVENGWKGIDINQIFLRNNPIVTPFGGNIFGFGNVVWQPFWASITTAQRNALNQFHGLLIYNVDIEQFQMYDGANWRTLANLEDSQTFTGANTFNGTVAFRQLTTKNVLAGEYMFTNHVIFPVFTSPYSITVAGVGQTNWTLPMESMRYGIMMTPRNAFLHYRINAGFFSWQLELVDISTGIGAIINAGVIGAGVVVDMMLGVGVIPINPNNKLVVTITTGNAFDNITFYGLQVAFI